MGFPNDNLPSLDGQRDYMRIYDVRQYTRYLQTIATKCNIQNDTNFSESYRPYNLQQSECEHVGQTMEILRYEQDNILAKLQRRSYRVKCDDNGRYYVTEMSSVQHNLLYGEDSFTVKSALMFARRPAMQFGTGGMHALSALLSYEGNITITKPYHDDIASTIRGIKNYGVDRRHARILLDHLDVSDEQLLARVNSTYVNVLYDCDRLCAQSILSSNNSFISTSELTKHSLLCMHRLIETPQTTDSTLLSTANTSAITMQATNRVNVGVVAGVVMSLLIIPGALFCLFAMRSSRFAQRINNVMSRITGIINTAQGMRRVTSRERVDNQNTLNELHEQSHDSVEQNETAVNLLSIMSHISEESNEYSLEEAAASETQSYLDISEYSLT